jgi:putative phosphoesterase
LRLGIVSDIHCNFDGLRTALERMGPVDELLCAGDTIFEYRFNNEVVELLREREARVILGNHEAVLYGPQGARARAAAQVRKDALDYLGAMPWLIDVDVGGKRLIMAHGSPVEPLNEYVFPDSPALQRLAQVEADYIVLGHTHHQMAARVGRALVINPGSAGDPRDLRNGRRLSYAVLDTASGEVTFDDYEAVPGKE